MVMQPCNTLEELKHNLLHIIEQKRYLPKEALEEFIASHLSVLNLKIIVTVDNDNSDTYFISLELTNSKVGMLTITVVQPKVLIDVLEIDKFVSRGD